ncbi:unnamed protein product [Ectocarpus sp. 12 AP-2014]
MAAARHPPRDKEGRVDWDRGSCLCGIITTAHQRTTAVPTCSRRSKNRLSFCCWHGQKGATAHRTLLLTFLREAGQGRAPREKRSKIKKAILVRTSPLPTFHSQCATSA